MNLDNIKSALIADDHELFSDGIALLVRSMFPKAEIIQARDFSETWYKLTQHPQIDLVLIDVKMPRTKGLNGIRAVKASFPCHTIIVLSSMDSAITVNSIMRLGVNGFVSKSTSKELIKKAILSVLNGNNVIEAPSYQEQTIELSKRQQQTLQLMARGLTNKEIAQDMNISPHTAKEYVSKVINELQADNRTHAVQLAEQHGLLFDT